MGIYDQAARRAAHEDPHALATRLGIVTGLGWRFVDWTQTQTTPEVEDRDQIADRVAIFEEGGRLWLGVMEFQSKHNPEKLDDLLAEVGQFRRDLKHGPERTEKYLVMPILVYLAGECPSDESSLEMSSPNGYGVRYKPAPWEVAKDSAKEALDAYERKEISWGILFWAPLMAGADEAELVTRWLALVEKLEVSAKSLAQLKGIALVFAELAKRGQVWRRILEGWKMTESPIVNEWMEATRIQEAREMLLEFIQARFGSAVPREAIELIKAQTSQPMLRDWARQAGQLSWEEFWAYLRR